MRLLLVKSVSLLKRGDFLLQMSKKTAPLRNVSPSLTAVPVRYPRYVGVTLRPREKLNHCHAKVVSPGCCLRMCGPIRDEIIVVTSCLRSRMDIPDA
jgi:hypothetical protein